MPLAPVDATITIRELTDNPYPIYQRLRRQAPVLHVKAVGRTLLTRAQDTAAVKANPSLFSSDDPDTPMKRAFQAHTLMRKDGTEHLRERNAMAETFSPANLKSIWLPAYESIVDRYLDRLPRGEIVDLFPTLAGPVAARILAEVLGIPDATDEEMQYWSQALINGAGNFGWADEPFNIVNKCHAAMNTLIENQIPMLRATPDLSALSVMVNADEPIPMSQILANIKIAIGGGINEPRDALLTTLFGLLTSPEQLNEVKQNDRWGVAFEEGVRWVAPIQASSRLATEDTVIRGIDIPKGDVVMTIQASANRDEDIYNVPEEFNLLENKAVHQSFGNGPHFCLGKHLARNTISNIMLPKLFERFPDIRLANKDDVIFSGFGFRGPLNLPVQL